MKWMVPEEKLSPEQREIMKKVGQSNNKPIWVQGHAGSGKSVVLLYALSDFLILNKNANVAVVVFTHSLKDLLKGGLNQIPALRNRNIPVLTVYQMNRNIENGQRYDGIFCDEVQDLPIQFIRGMLQSCKQLVIAGDSAQSIYDQDPNLRLPTASMQQINNEIKPENHVLNLVFRLTKNVLNILQNVFSSLLGSKTLIGKENTDIRLYKANSYDEEVKWVWKEAKLINSNRTSEVGAILLFKKDDILDFVNRVLKIENKPVWSEETIYKFGREHLDFNSLNNYLREKRIPLIFVGNGYGSLDTAYRDNRIVIMTYHSAKGLDFDAVFLPKIDTDILVASNPNALALVALSRSKRDLIITFTSDISYTFKQFLKNVTIKSTNQSNKDILF